MPDYPGAIKSFDQQTDGVDDADAVDVNEHYNETEAMQIELGTDPAGAHTDVKSRLNQGLPDANDANTATLSATRTLTDADGVILNLDPDGTSRDVELPAEANTNHPFLITNTADGDGENLVVKSDAPATIITIRRGQTAYVYSDGTTWRAYIVNGTRAKQTVYIAASFMIPETTDGCAAISKIELTAGQPELFVLGFDGTTAEFAQFSFGFPKKWDKGTISFRVRWTSTAGDAAGAAWTLQAVAQANSNPIDVAFGSAVTVVDNADSASRDMYISSESGAVTIAGSPGDDEHVYFRIGRNPSHGSDDMGEDAELIGIDIFYLLEAESDD